MNFRSLSEQEQNPIDLYSHCQLGMTPQQFYAKWQVDQQTLALICSRSLTTVRGWFSRGRSYRRPQPSDLRHLTLMDFLLEHYQDVPEQVWELLCPQNRHE